MLNRFRLEGVGLDRAAWFAGGFRRSELVGLDHADIESGG
jgi:hypothetical protein